MENNVATIQPFDVESDNMKTGLDLRKFREKKNKSMRDFARLLLKEDGSLYSEGHLYEVERGKRPLTKEIKDSIKRVKSWE